MNSVKGAGKKVVRTDEEVMVRAEIMSKCDKVSDVLFTLFQMLVALKVTIAEIGSLAGDAGASKCQQIAEFIRDTIRGVKHDLSAAAVELAQKLGVIEEVTDIPAPHGGRVFRVLVMVDWAKSWRDYMLASCPQTDKSWDILNVGDQFESAKRGTTIEEVIFLWFGKNVNGTAEKADAWATTNGLASSHGRIPAAVIGTIPGIIGQLQNMGFPYSSVGIVSTSQCKLGEDPRVPCAWRRDDGGRRANLYHVSGVWNDHSLFVFVRK